VNASLQDLHLEDNEIGVDGAVALADAIRVNGSILDLNLENNDIGDDGAVALADALRFNESSWTLKRIYRWLQSWWIEDNIALAPFCELFTVIKLQSYRCYSK
jgi:Leucine Rich repeat